MDEIKKININPLKKIKNPKGDILHALKHTDLDYYGFGEAYFSTIIKNQIKGWNRHKKMIINLIVPYGKVKFVVYDDESNSRHKFKSYILSSDEYNRLTIHPGLWVAFKGLGPTPNLVLNVANIAHDPQESEKLDLSKIDFNWNNI